MRERVDVADLSLKDVMIKNPAVTNSRELLALAVQTMEEKGITSLVVLNDELQPQGVVYLHDALALGF